MILEAIQFSHNGHDGFGKQYLGLANTFQNVSLSVHHAAGWHSNEVISVEKSTNGQLNTRFLVAPVPNITRVFRGEQAADTLQTTMLITLSSWAPAQRDAACASSAFVECTSRYERHLSSTITALVRYGNILRCVLVYVYAAAQLCPKLCGQISRGSCNSTSRTYYYIGIIKPRVLSAEFRKRDKPGQPAPMRR